MRQPALSRATVDRDGAHRDDQAWLDEAWSTALVLVVEDGKAVIEDGLVLVPGSEAPDGDRLYLGSAAGQAFFTVAGPLPRRLGARPLGLRDAGVALSDRDAGLFTHAVGLLAWHDSETFCSRCGEPLASAKGGAVRRCPQGHEHFPRTDPAVIVLVTDGADRALLGRQPIWPPGRYSTLAGFVEPGESAEQAVVREVLEETGVSCWDVVPVASQPWPFPRSLMLGFRAVCAPDAVPQTPDDELEDARWFTKAELRDGTALLPSPISIAWLLIQEWLDEPV